MSESSLALRLASEVFPDLAPTPARSLRLCPSPGASQTFPVPSSLGHCPEPVDPRDAKCDLECPPLPAVSRHLILPLTFLVSLLWVLAIPGGTCSLLPQGLEGLCPPPCAMLPGAGASHPHLVPAPRWWPAAFCLACTTSHSGKTVTTQRSSPSLPGTIAFI